MTSPPSNDLSAWFAKHTRYRVHERLDAQALGLSDHVDAAVLYLEGPAGFRKYVYGKRHVGRGASALSDSGAQGLLRQVAGINYVHLRTIFDLSVSDDAVVVIEGSESGTNLQTFLQRQRSSPSPLDSADAAHIALGVCQGLAAVHARGIAHGRLLPHHIYLSAHGYAQVGDFDVAMADPSRAEQDDVASARQLLQHLAALTDDADFSSLRLPDHLEDAFAVLGSQLALRPCASLAGTMRSLFHWQVDDEPLLDHLCYPDVFPSPIHDWVTPTCLAAPVFITDPTAGSLIGRD